MIIGSSGLNRIRTFPYCGAPARCQVVVTRGVGRANCASVGERRHRSMGMALALVLLATASGTDTLVEVMMATETRQVPIGVGGFMSPVAMKGS